MSLSNHNCRASYIRQPCGCWEHRAPFFSSRNWTRIAATATFSRFAQQHSIEGAIYIRQGGYHAAVLRATSSIYNVIIVVVIIVITVTVPQSSFHTRVTTDFWRSLFRLSTGKWSSLTMRTLPVYRPVQQLLFYPHCRPRTDNLYIANVFRPNTRISVSRRNRSMD